MKKLILAPLVGAVLLLGACAGELEVRATNALAIACDTYSVALDQLTPLKADGSLSEQNIARVDATNALVDPVCLPGSIVDPASAVIIVREGVDLLKAVKEAV